MAKETCPACGGAGGGPFGRAGSAWDTEDYVCPRCAGAGVILTTVSLPASVRPGIAKPPQAVPAEKPAKKKAKG
jgi:DnaJ-class molecular chaperone